MGLVAVQPLRPRRASDGRVPPPPGATPPTRCGDCSTVVPDTVQGRRDRAILLVFVLTGRRRSEVMGLTAGDIEIEDGTVFYRYRGKGGKQRTARAAATSLGGHPTDARGLRQGAGDDGAGGVAVAGRCRPKGLSGSTFYARFRRYLVDGWARSRPGCTSSATAPRSSGAMPGSRSRRSARSSTTHRWRSRRRTCGGSRVSRTTPGSGWPRPSGCERIGLRPVHVRRRATRPSRARAASRARKSGSWALRL